MCDEETSEELEELLEKENIPIEDRQYYRDLYAQEKSHYKFGQKNEMRPPPPFQPKKKGWTLLRLKRKDRKRTV